MVTQSEDYQVINAVDHADVCVKTGEFHYLKKLNNSAVVAEEVADVAAECPIVFLRDEASGKFQLSALFGLKPEENLFVDSQGEWSGTYIPVNFSIKPFGTSGETKDEESVLCIDMNSAKVSKEDGKKLFENGVESRYLIGMRQQLETIIDATIQTEKLTAELVNRNLLTECKLVITGLSEEPQVISDLYTINTAEFSFMSKEDVLMFHEMGYWGAVYGIQHSMRQFKKLVKMRNSQYPDSQIKLAVHISREDS